MKKRKIVFGLVFVILLLAGCCGLTGPSALGCTTYGEACTEFCNKARGTAFDYGPNCFSQCMDDVRSQGLGDATTCCKESMKQQCERVCKSRLSAIAAKYGQPLDEEEVGECMDECVGAYIAIGMSPDSCSLIDMESLE